MNILGFEISRAKSVKASAVVPLPTSGDVDMIGVIPPLNRIPEWGSLGGYATGEPSLDGRLIHSDPRDLYYLGLPNKLTPQQCLLILRSALGGDIWQQWQLLSILLDTWPVFRMASHQLREKASYVKYNVIAHADDGDEPSVRAKEKASLVSRALKSFDPNPFNDEKGMSGMVYDFCDAMFAGLSMSELIWQRKNSAKYGIEYMPKAAAWLHPRHYTFTNDGMIAIFDDNYSRLYYHPSFQNSTAPIGRSPDPRKFICSQFISKSGSVLGAGLMRPLVWYWAARQFNSEWMLNTAQKYGSPFLDVTYKPGSFQTGSDANSEMTQLTNMLKKASANKWLIHPEGTTVNIEKATSLGTDNPQRYIQEEADRQCLKLLLGQEGTTHATPGKLGNDDAHETVKEDRIQGLSQWVARNPLRQFARAVIAMNYGDQDMDDCPFIEPDFTKPLDAQAAAQWIKSVKDSGLPVAADEIYTDAGFSKPKPGSQVFHNGQISIFEEPITPTEKAETELARQVDLSQKTSKEKSPKVSARATLTKATDAELAEMESLVLKAEQAPHVNGELTAVRERLEMISRRS